MSPGLLGNEGERYQRRRGPVRAPGVTLALAPPVRRPNVDTGSRRTSPEAPDGRSRGVGAGATDSRSASPREHWCSWPGARGRRRRRVASASAAEARRPAQVSLAVGRRRGRRLARSSPLEISVTDGELGDVTVVDGAGADGAPAAVARRRRRSRAPTVWTPEAQLAYGTSYTLTADGDERRRRRGDGDLDLHHRHARRRSPRRRIGPLDGTTVGVGMPIRVYFDDPVADKAAVESHLKVTTLHARPTASWNWMSDSEVHFRPVAVLAGQHRGHARRRTCTA